MSAAASANTLSLKKVELYEERWIAEHVAPAFIPFEIIFLLSNPKI